MSCVSFNVIGTTNSSSTLVKGDGSDVTRPKEQVKNAPFN